MFDGDIGRLIWFILAFTLGAVWLVCVCIIIVFAIMRMINTAKNRVESARFQRIFRFLLKAILPFFFALFLAGGCSTIFVSPQVYLAYYLCNKNAKQNVYDKNLYENLEKRDTYTGKEIIPANLRYLPDLLDTQITKTERVTNRIIKKWYKPIP